MTTGVVSKAWDWEQQDEQRWLQPSDEFLPVARRWQDRGWKRAADIGCGLGRHSLLLASMGFDVLAVDLSRQGLDRLESEARRLRLDDRIRAVQADLVDVPEDFGAFDCVLSFHAIYHTDLDGMKRALSWIIRHLRPGGGFYVTFNSKNSATFRRTGQRHVDGCTVVRETGPEAGIPHTYLSYEDIVRLLEGYELAKVQQIEDYYRDGGSGIHFFVEAYRPTA